MSTQPYTTPSYARRRPELTPHYRILQGYLNTFKAERQDRHYRDKAIGLGIKGP